MYNKIESGIELIFDIDGTDMKVDINPVSNYNECERIVIFLNFVMEIYNEYNENNKDKYNLFRNNNIHEVFNELEKIQIEESEQVELPNEIITPDESLKEESEDIKEDSTSEKTDQLITEEEHVLEQMSEEQLKEEELEDMLESMMEDERYDSDSDSQSGGYNVNRYY